VFPLKGLQTIARLRITSHPLRMCTGRMRDIPHALRLCEGGGVKDLPHFLLRCPRYVAVRAHFGDVETSVFFNGQDQVVVAHAVVSTLQFRMVALQV